jgi:predicted HTH transcriptional regulator
LITSLNVRYLACIADYKDLADPGKGFVYTGLLGSEALASLACMANTDQMDYDSIINEAAQQLENRFADIQKELEPLRLEESKVAEAIQRLVGSFPEGYRAPAPARMAPKPSGPPRERLNPEERQAQVLQLISENPGGVNGKFLANELGVSSATVTKAVDALLADGRIKAEGQRAGRKLFPG